jgi:aldoxime dehydratase
MEGIAVTAEALSDMVQEHAYWGGMRDRIPLSQTDAMKADGGPKADGANGHVRIVPHENLCLIRSGQDWSDTDDAERKMYIEDVEPVLRAGMEFLRDDGLSCGCFANRYMRVVGSDGNRWKNPSE